jgi:hypothetical protein
LALNQDVACSDGSATDIANGSGGITVGAGLNVKASLKAAGSISLGKGASVVGNLDAATTIAMQDSTKVTGNVTGGGTFTPTLAAASSTTSTGIEIDGNVTVGTFTGTWEYTIRPRSHIHIKGKLTTTSGEARVNSSSYIEKGIDAKGDIYVSDACTIGLPGSTGTMLNSASDINLYSGGNSADACKLQATTINGDVLASRNVVTGGAAECLTVNGNVESTAGGVTFTGARDPYDNTITGNVTAGTSIVLSSPNTTVGGNVLAGSTVTLGDNGVYGGFGSSGAPSGGVGHIGDGNSFSGTGNIVGTSVNGDAADNLKIAGSIKATNGGVNLSGSASPANNHVYGDITATGAVNLGGSYISVDGNILAGSTVTLGDNGVYGVFGSSGAPSGGVGHIGDGNSFSGVGNIVGTSVSATSANNLKIAGSIKATTGGVNLSGHAVGGKVNNHVYGDIIATGGTVTLLGAYTPAYTKVDGNITANAYSGGGQGLDNSACPPAQGSTDYTRGCNIDIGGTLTVNSAPTIGVSTRVGGIAYDGAGTIRLSHDNIISKSGITAPNAPMIISSDNNNECIYKLPCDVQITGNVTVASINTGTNWIEGLRVWGDVASTKGTINLIGDTADNPEDTNNIIYGNVRSASTFFTGEKGIVYGNVYATSTAAGSVLLSENASVTGCIYAPSSQKDAVQPHTRGAVSSGGTTYPATTPAGVVATVNTAPNPAGKGVCCYNSQMSACSADNNCLNDDFSASDSALMWADPGTAAKANDTCHNLAPSIEKKVNGGASVSGAKPGDALQFTIKVTPNPLDIVSATANLSVTDNLDVANMTDISVVPPDEGTVSYNQDTGYLVWSGIPQNLLSASLTINAKAKCDTGNIATVRDEGRGLGVDSNRVSIAVEGSSCGTAFEATEAGQAPQAARSPLYTKLANEGFSLDIHALSAPGATTSKPWAGNVDVGLVEAGSQAACEAMGKPANAQTVAFGDPGATPPVQDPDGTVGVDFEGQDPAKVFYVWMKDAGNASAKVYCSSDSFSVRPQSFAVAAYKSDGSTLDNSDYSNQGGNPSQKAGKAFYIRAVDQSTGAAQVGGDGLGTAGMLAANYGSDIADPATRPSCVFQAANGRYACTYANVGLLKFAGGAFNDGASYVSQSGSNDVANGDCRASNAAGQAWNDKGQNGRYGCSIPSAAFIAGRWYPAFFEVGATLAEPWCAGSGIAYMGQPDAMSASFKVVAAAEGAGGAIGDAATLYSNKAFSLAAYDGANQEAAFLGRLFVSSGTQVLAFSGTTLANGGSWVDGEWSFPETKFMFSRTDAKEGAYDFRLAFSLSDPDLGRPDDPIELDTGAIGSALCASPVSGSAFPCGAAQAGSTAQWKRVSLRHGMLDVHSAYGARNAEIPVPVHIVYWAKNHWAISKEDTCTYLTYAGLKAKLAAADTIAWAGAGNEGKDPVQSGNGSDILRIKSATDKLLDLGVADACAMGVYNAGGCSSVAASQCAANACPTGWLDADMAPVCIGRCGRPGAWIYKRSVVAPR